MVKRDLKNRKDIDFLVSKFYEKVMSDDTIGFYFTKVVKIHWERHMELMGNFWENVLFHSGHYEGNPMKRHQELNEKNTLTSVHFDQWTKLFSETIDEHFIGTVAETAKQRASSIAKVMVHKLNG